MRQTGAGGYKKFSEWLHTLLRVLSGSVRSEARRNRAKQRVDDIVSTGELILEARCFGEIDLLHIPFLSVRVYPGGLLVRTFTNRTISIRLDEIRVVREYNYFMRRRVAITHRSTDTTSGILILSGEESKSIKAVLDLLMQKATR